MNQKFIVIVEYWIEDDSEKSKVVEHFGPFDEEGEADFWAMHKKAELGESFFDSTVAPLTKQHKF